MARLAPPLVITREQLDEEHAIQRTVLRQLDRFGFRMVHALHLPAENKKAPDFWHLDIVNELASCKEGEIMFSDSRAYER